MARYTAERLCSRCKRLMKPILCTCTEDDLPCLCDAVDICEDCFNDYCDEQGEKDAS